MAEQSNGLAADTSSYENPTTNKLLATPTNTPQAASDWLTVMQQKQNLSSSQFDLAKQHLGALNNLAASVITDPTSDNALARINDGQRLGVISPENAENERQTINSFGGDPTKIQQYGYQHLGTIMSVQEHLNTSYGAPGTVDNGQVISPVRTVEGPNAGVYAAGGNAMQKYMAPAEANAPHTYTDPVTGRTINTTIRGQNQAVGDTAGLPPTIGATAPSPAPAPGYSGVGSPSSYADPRRAAAAGVSVVDGHPVYGAPPPAPPGTQPGDVVRPSPVGSTYGSRGSGPTIAGAGVAQTQPQPPAGGASQPTVPGLAGPSPMLGGGIEDYRADLNNSAAKMQGVQPLLSALPLIRQLGATGSGPGTKAFNDAKSALVSAGIIPAGATDVDVRDEANKYLNQYVAKSGIAQRSDMGTLVSQQSSPNLETSNAATDALTQNAIAQDRMEAARPLAYKSNDLSGYDQHKATWTQSQDARAYKLDVMPADQRTALLTSIAAKRNSPEGRKFFSSLQNAMGAKVVTPPSAPPAMGAPGGQ